MSVKLFKKEVDDYLLNYNNGLKETNLSGVIMSYIDQIANKHGFILEVEDIEHISFIFNTWIKKSHPEMAL